MLYKHLYLLCKFAAEAVEHSSCLPANDKVRGFNHPCAIICHRIKGYVCRLNIGSQAYVTNIHR